MTTGTPTPTVVVMGPADRVEELAHVLDAGGLEVVGITDAVGAEELVAAGAPDVVVTTAGADELAATARVGSTAAATRFVAVVDTDAHVSPDALLEGRVGAVVGADQLDELPDAARGITHGEARLDAALAALVLERIGAGEPDVDPLSDTESEVLSRLAAGDAEQSIAEEYGVSPRLVRMYAGGAVSRVLPR